MQSTKRKDLMRLLALTLIAPLLTHCAPAARINSANSACSALLPDSWRKGVEGAPLPTGQTVGDWIAFADAQTGQLDKANDRTIAAIGIQERCEARDAAALKRAKRWF
jgi:hypothetical protein